MQSNWKHPIFVYGNVKGLQLLCKNTVPISTFSLIRSFLSLFRRNKGMLEKNNSSGTSIVDVTTSTRLIWHHELRTKSRPHMGVTEIHCVCELTSAHQDLRWDSGLGS